MVGANLNAIGLGWLSSVMGILLLAFIAGLLCLIIRFVRRKHYLLACAVAVPLIGLLVIPA